MSKIAGILALIVGVVALVALYAKDLAPTASILFGLLAVAVILLAWPPSP